MAIKKTEQETKLGKSQQQDQQMAVQEFIEYMNSSNASSTESETE